jgi:mono/diheme cytochrome c family protein
MKTIEVSILSRLRTVCGAVLVMFVATLASAADDKNPVTYNDDIKPIFRQHCLKCHGDDKQESGLNLQNFQAAIKGGSGGKAVVAGRASASLLYEAITNEDADARMPPNQPPLPEAQVKLILAWIEGGLRETVGSKSLTESRDLSFKPTADAMSKPDGPATVPVNWPLVKLPVRQRKLPVVSMDTSPWAPLVAVAGWQHVRVLNTETQTEAGVLPFPEGVPHVVRFSRNGSVLLVAGGKPVQSGRAVLFDVRTGKRLAEIGDEVDAVLAADLSPNQQLVAIGGSGKVVKVYDTSSGMLKFLLTRHTDWITAMAFSPDGKKLATSDRAGGLQIWDATNGGILLTLAEHKASIASLHWRGDSRVLASTGEDGRLIWWDVVDGWPAISKNNAHPPRRPTGEYGNLRNGILSAAFGPDGKLLTAGRDKVVRFWKPDGQAIKSFEVVDAIPTATRISHDGRTLICGDSHGIIHFWPAP